MPSQTVTCLITPGYVIEMVYMPHGPNKTVERIVDTAQVNWNYFKVKVFFSKKIKINAVSVFADTRYMKNVNKPYIIKEKLKKTQPALVHLCHHFKCMICGILFLFQVMTTTVPCVDALQNCDVYNYTRICDRDGIYATWAKQNCGAYCGHCTSKIILKFFLVRIK